MDESAPLGYSDRRQVGDALIPKCKTSETLTCTCQQQRHHRLQPLSPCLSDHRRHLDFSIFVRRNKPCYNILHTQLGVATPTMCGGGSPLCIVTFSVCGRGITQVALHWTRGPRLAPMIRTAEIASSAHLVTRGKLADYSVPPLPRHDTVANYSNRSQLAW